MNTELSVERRAAVHAALGDPARVAIVDALAAGDAAPGELAGQLGVGSNLLAHHLKVLEGAGLVRRTRSEGDRRRTYVTLVAEALAGIPVGTPLHAPRILFVCSRNSARSQIAAALWCRRSTIPVASAGTRPAREVHPAALAAIRRHGLSLPAARTHHVAEVTGRDDLVIAVCDQAHEEMGELRRLHWSIPDPVRAGTDQAFDDAFGRLSRRISRLAAILTAATTSTPILEESGEVDDAEPVR
ncbi:helix-turn-helix domain-containing protein [Phytoactinopolyspora alkaliphila]|uniref:Helix-turn-helix domain-containing protein n=1 Tax=Phytoactinopolyspora alkaliphila TaxID=1783498 RepID=A0A6N9YM33_9ACTN|nr:helix-turn-helix domain-containing protein [Phytoactinopolyspora alkaliphila]NED95980.1 helix-turn-helix domain-containing protein [Phytoactinopolyspora alkaliphila]